MAVDYVALGKKVDAVLKQVGLKVIVARAGTNIGNGYGVFVSSTAKNETASSSSLLAQTSITDRALLLSGLVAQPIVGDLVTADKNTYTVVTVEVVRPTSTTMLYKLALK